MFKALEIWSDACASWLSVAQTASKLSAMAGASAYVVDKRTQMMAHAMRNPMDGDYAELAMMVPEKVAAFSAAGLAGMQAIGAAQADQFALWQGMMTMTSPADGVALARQSARASRRAAGATGRIIAPMHRTATANARRLRKK